jgi:hypothetical protein
LADVTSQPLSAAEGTIGSDGPIRHIVQNVSISAFKADPINSRVFIMVNDAKTNRTIRVVPYSGYVGPLPFQILSNKLHPALTNISWLG